MKTKCPVYIVVGPIGAEISTVLSIVKTMGYYTVDGLPMALVPDLLALPGMLTHSAGIVLGLDVRGNSAKDSHKVLVELRARNLHPFVFYLETKDTLHARRAGLSRRYGLDARDASDCLGVLRDSADCILETDCSEPLLRSRLFSFFARPDMLPRIRVTSFCVASGYPDDVAFLLDLRFLPLDFSHGLSNGLSGDRERDSQENTSQENASQENTSKDDRALVDTFFSNRRAKEYLEHILTLLDDLLTRFADTSHLKAANQGECHIAFGSTHGRYRSVAFALAVADHYIRRGCDVTVKHRDRERGEPNDQNPNDQNPQDLHSNDQDDLNDPKDQDTAASFQMSGQTSGTKSADQQTAKTLRQYLKEQLDKTFCTDSARIIGEVILDHINSEGYLPGGVEEMAVRTKRPVLEVVPVLERIQHFDPIGSATKDARECLLVQVKDRGYSRDSTLYSFVDEHVEDILGGNFHALYTAARAASLDSPAILDILAALAPRPCFTFWESLADVSVRSVNGRFVVRLRGQGKPCARDVFLDTTEERTSWFASLDPRSQSIYLVAESLVRLQRAFFQSGPMQIVPLTLSRVASDTGRDESTVSRVTVKHTIATSFGLFPMKTFFASGLETDDGRIVSSVSVQIMLRELIESEDPAHPLSDDELTAILNERLHTSMARRTVAKYRSLIGIASSSGRRVR
ncbi:MAG: hypothetical protein IJU76_03920 [Desulfovibrionaceae bacterium]|nr:hypothetical protein [Desulfovibrionaceae bacterium]